MRAVARRVNILGPAIAERLRLARELRGLTVRQLAEQAQVDKQTVQRLSDGLGRNPGAGMMADLAKALDVSPAWLTFGEGSPPT